MSDSEPPRIRVTLPGGVSGRLLRWRQGPDGRWWAETVVYAPATAVQQVAGEDYAGVPREPAGPRYVMVATVDPGRPRHAEIHTAGCFAIPAKSSLRPVTDLPSAAAARDMLRFDDTSPCSVCTPDP